MTGLLSAELSEKTRATMERCTFFWRNGFLMTGLLSAELSEKTRATKEVYLFLSKMVSE